MLTLHESLSCAICDLIGYRLSSSMNCCTAKHHSCSQSTLSLRQQDQEFLVQTDNIHSAPTTTGRAIPITQELTGPNLHRTTLRFCQSWLPHCCHVAALEGTDLGGTKPRLVAGLPWHPLATCMPITIELSEVPGLPSHSLGQAAGNPNRP